MKRRKASLMVGVVLALGAGSVGQGSVPAPLKLETTLPLPPVVQGHFDHFAIDTKHHRMFAAAVDQKAVLVVDITTGRFIASLPMPVPRGILYREDLDRVYVSEGGEGALRIYNGTSCRLLKTVRLAVDADPITYNPATNYIYVVNGGEKAKQAYSLISVVDTSSGKHLDDIQVPGMELEAMTIERSGPRLFVNNRDKNQVDVIDRERRRLIASWPVTLAKGNTSIGLDESTHRLFVACRSGQLVVMNSDSGKELEAFPIGQGVDDLAFDPASKRIYMSCGGGEGSVDVYQELDSDHFQFLARVPSAPQAATSRLVTELGRYFVLAPAQSMKPAEILIYKVQ